MSGVTQQDYVLLTVRPAAILTNSFVAGQVIGPTSPLMTEQNQMILYVDFTLGLLTNGQIKVEFSHDGSDYYQETSGVITTGAETDTVFTHFFNATGKFRIPIPIKDRYIKISAGGVGTVTASSMKILAVIGVA